MPTLLSLGPTDHGRTVSLEEFRTARWLEGYRYELIGGKLYVSPTPNLPHERIAHWIQTLLEDYGKKMPSIMNYVTARGRVIVPDDPEVTWPEPDVTVFRGFPLHLPFSSVQWEDLNPVLVVEVISEDDPNKDLVRNVELYEQVPSIREYWVLDPRTDPDHPSLVVYRRRGQRWQRPIEVGAGDVYETRLLPRFRLVLDPNA
jgi:Uma2 family endonuclease